LLHLESAAALAAEEGFAYQRAVGACLRGWASVLQGRPDDAIVHLRDSLAGYRATGAALARPVVYALLGNASAMAGRPEEGLAHVAEGMSDATRTGQLFHLIELNLTRGDLLIWSGEPAGAIEAEACYRRALDSARAFRAPMLELRAATHLARLWSQQGRSDAAGTLLAPLVAGFSEGLELRDLQMARAVLGQ
jgi:predicted ATPase